MSLADDVIELVERLKEPLNLDRWYLKLEHGPLADAKAACSAEPEYKQATIAFDLEKLVSGDEIDEIIVHEMMHCHTWAAYKLTEDLANTVADSAPEYMREALRTKLAEEARSAGEDVNTQVAFVVVKLLRRLWAAEAQVKELKKRLRQVDKGVLLG